ncbi:MAG: hypothetical protein Q8934_08435 [Bacillota bacterium]|nr:hypothetical protein [Bacillota bacterium]
MKKLEAFRLLVLIESAYPHFKIKSDIVESILQGCEDIDYIFSMKKIVEHIRCSPYPPLLSGMIPNYFTQFQDHDKKFPWLSEYTYWQLNI